MRSRRVPDATRWIARIAVFLPVLLAACGASSSAAESPSQSPPTACLTAAHGNSGVVAAWFQSKVGTVRQLPYARSLPQLANYAIDEDAALCYIDGQIPKGPPPPQSGTIPPSFDREVIVVIRDQAYFVSAGYRRNMAIETP